MKKAVFAILIVLAMCVGLFSACAKTTFDDDTLQVALANLQRDMLLTTETPESYKLPSRLSNYLDSKGNEVPIYVKWAIEDSDKVTITEGTDEVTVNITETRPEAISYNLRATLTDADGTAYKDGNNKNYTVVSPRTAPATTPVVGGDDDESEWSDYVGESYVLYDIEGYDDSVTIAIGAETITVTHEGTPVEITEIEYLPADATYNYDEFCFVWEDTDMYLDIFEDGRVEFTDYDGEYFGYYYVLEDYINVDPTPDNDWSAYVGESYTLVAYDFDSEKSDLTDFVTVTINADNITITKGEETTTINGIQYFVDGVYYFTGYDEFDFTWKSQVCALCIYENDYVALEVGENDFYDNEYEGTPGGGDQGGGEETGDWTEHVGKSFALYDVEGYDDSVTIVIGAESITVTHDGSSVEITDIYYSPADAIYNYDEFCFIWEESDMYLDIFPDGRVEFTDYNGEDFYYYYVLEDYVNDDGTLSTDWSAHIGTYRLYASDGESIDTSDSITIKVEAGKIVITQNGVATDINEITYYVDTLFFGDVSDDLCFYWGEYECILSFYEDGELVLSGDLFYIGSDEDIGGGDIGGGGTGGEVVPGSTVTIDFSDQKFSNQQAVTSFTANGVTFTFTGGGASAAWFDTGEAIRVYYGGSMTVSGAEMVKIVLHFGSSDKSNTITVNAGNYSSGTWTGSASSVTFSVGGSSGHRRIAGVTITFADGSEGGEGGGSDQGGGSEGGGTGGDIQPSTGTVTFDFVKSFADYASFWSNQYLSKTVTASQMGLQNTVEFVFSYVSKQTEGNPISDRPVMAAKQGETQYLTVNGGGSKITAVTFNLEEWVPVDPTGKTQPAPKKFTKVCIEYSTDGTSWNEVENVGFEDAAGRQITEYQTLTATALPENVVSVRLAITGGGTGSNQQVGVSSVVLTLA